MELDKHQEKLMTIEEAAQLLNVKYVGLEVQCSKEQSLTSKLAITLGSIDKSCSNGLIAIGLTQRYLKNHFFLTKSWRWCYIYR